MAKYTEEQKAEAIILALYLDNIREAGRQLGIPKSTVAGWVKTADENDRMHAAEMRRECAARGMAADADVGLALYRDNVNPILEPGPAPVSFTEELDANSGIDVLATDPNPCATADEAKYGPLPETPVGWDKVETSVEEPQTAVSEAAPLYSTSPLPTTKIKGDITPTAWSESNYRRNVRLNQTPILAEAAHLARRTGRKVRRIIRSAAFSLLALLLILGPTLINLATAPSSSRRYLGVAAAMTVRGQYQYTKRDLLAGWVACDEKNSRGKMRDGAPPPGLSLRSLSL